MAVASGFWPAFSTLLPLPGLLLGFLTFLRGPARGREDRPPAAAAESLGAGLCAAALLAAGGLLIAAEGTVPFLMGCAGCLGGALLAAAYQALCVARECAGRRAPVCWPCAVVVGICGLASHESGGTVWGMYAAVWLGCAFARAASPLFQERVWITLDREDRRCPAAERGRP